MKEAFENGKKPRFARGKLLLDVPLCDHITPHYANLGLIKLPDIVKLLKYLLADLRSLCR